MLDGLRRFGCAERAKSESHDLFQPSDKIAIFLFQLGDPLPGGGKLALESRQAADYPSASGLPGLRCLAAASAAMIAVRSTSASVRGAAGRSPRFGVRELSKVRIAGNCTRSSMPCPGAHKYPSPRCRRGSSPRMRLPFLPVGLALDPGADRVAVLARGQFHRDQDVGLRQHVLVHDRRALRDQPRDEAAHAAAAHDLLDMAEQAFSAFDRPLRRP